MRIDVIAKMRHLLQVWAFCLAIATLLYSLNMNTVYGPGVAYSMMIGTFSWLIIDMGRELIPSARETGWPRGWQGVALVVVGSLVGYLAGTTAAHQLCLYYGWYPADARPTGGNLLNSIIISAIAALSISYYFYSVNKSAYLERKMGEARKHANEARLKLLETQLEPHMLFNTLANLRALIGVDPSRAQLMLDHMIAYLRATLSASRNATHALQSEFDRLQDYLELMAIRMGPRLAFSLALPDELAQARVPALLLQPLVENSIQHGLEPKVEGGRIDILARRDGGYIELAVRDTGVGSAAAPQGGKGFGLSQIRERLAAMYGEDASFRFDAQPGAGCVAIIRFPADA